MGMAAFNEEARRADLQYIAQGEAAFNEEARRADLQHIAQGEALGNPGPMKGAL